MVAGLSLNETLEAVPASPSDASCIQVTHGVGRGLRHHHVHASFSALKSGGLHFLVKDMKAISRDMTNLDTQLKDSIKDIPKAIKELAAKFKPVTENVTAGIGDTLDNAKLVREKVDVFNERIER